MKKVNFNNKKTIKNITEYILCLLLVEFMIVGAAIIKIHTNNPSKETVSYFETANVGNAQTMDKQSSNKVKYEIIDSNETSLYIKVNLKNQNVKVYAMDEDGNYSILVRKMICSTGTYTPTSGVFSLSDKFEWAYLVGNVYGQYATRITGAILFHSVPYTQRSKSSLEYWEYDKLGQVASKGCVRLTVEDAKWIFDYCEKGTLVEFCSEDDDTNDELVEKKLMKISEFDEELKGWDPTDPDMQNPWINYIEQNKGEVE